MEKKIRITKIMEKKPKAPSPELELLKIDIDLEKL